MRIERDWTLTDQAEAADAERDRNWWRRPYPAGPDAESQEADDPTPTPRGDHD